MMKRASLDANPEQIDRWHDAAREAGLSFGRWARMALDAASGVPVPVQASPTGGDLGSVQPDPKSGKGRIRDPGVRS